MAAAKETPAPPPAEAAEAAAVPQRFDDVYECTRQPEDELGRGAFSTVYRCKHRETGVEYAAKCIRMRHLPAQARKCLQTEVAICHRLDHPNIVKLRADFEEEDFHYLVFDLVTGGELFDDIVRREQYSEDDASRCIQMVLEALQHCHSRGILHRDLKPENLLLSDNTRNAQVQLTDFGISIFLTNPPKFHGRAGTPTYFAPEVVKRQPYHTAADVWSAGVLLYILLCGYPPFAHEPGMDKMFEDIKNGNYEFEAPDWDDISDSAKDLVSRMLDVNPNTRITVAQALAHPWIHDRRTTAPKLHMQKTISSLQSFNARRKLRGAIHSVIGLKRLARGGEALRKRSRASESSDVSDTGAMASSAAPEP
eukprot:m.307196 g.307196  ORF g.307196 m.307196 type:complete len:366 (+) comp19807_c0_seq1:2-1099(+)